VAAEYIEGNTIDSVFSHTLLGALRKKKTFTFVISARRISVLTRRD
jgi:hypothetical protein